MKFVKEDYEKKRQKKNIIVIFSVIIAVAVIVWLVQSTGEETGPGVQSKDTSLSPLARKQKRDRLSTGEKEEKKEEKKQKIDLPTLVKQCKRAIVVIETFDRGGKRLGQGSGFFINKNGHIISNRHVFQGAHSAVAKVPGRSYGVKEFLAEDVASDLILLSVVRDYSRTPSLPISENIPEVGESIVVIGNPLGLEATVSNGIVSARRQLDPFGTVIQITSPISPGSSGSPVLNMWGEVVGVATFQFRQGQNLNFAIPIQRAKKLIAQDRRILADLSFVDSDLIDSAQTPFDRGMVYYEAGEYANAVAQFREALKTDVGNAEIYFHLGLCYKKNSLTDAVDAFKTAVDMDPEYAEAHCNLGIVYNRLNMHKEAAIALREALRIRPYYAEAQLNLGAAYVLGKEYRAAISVLEKAVENKPDGKAYYYLSISYRAVKKTSEAIGALETSIKLDSEYMPAFILLGYLHIEVKNWRRGIKKLNEAVILEPDNPEAHYLLGMMHLGNNDLASAEHQLEILKELKKRRRDPSNFDYKLRDGIYRYKSRLRYGRR